MCEFCPTSGPCSMPWCRNHWSAPLLVAESRFKALRRGQRRDRDARREFARFVYFGALAGFVGLVALAWAGVG